MLPDRVSNPGPLTYESGALPIALRGPAKVFARRRQGYDNTSMFSSQTAELIKNLKMCMSNTMPPTTCLALKGNGL